MSGQFKWEAMAAMMKPEEVGASLTSLTKLDAPTRPAAASAYLGPKLWDKPIQAKFNEDDFFVMNIDEFLAENDLQLAGRVEGRGEESPEPEHLPCVSPDMASSVSPPRVDEVIVPTRPSIIVARGETPSHFLLIIFISFSFSYSF